MTAQPRQLRDALERRLLELPEVTIDTWKDTELVCVAYRGKEFAHFHGVTILDLRLSTKIIREEALSRDVSARVHPKRSTNSCWICLEIKDLADVEDLVRLCAEACDLMN